MISAFNRAPSNSMYSVSQAVVFLCGTILGIWLSGNLLRASDNTIVQHVTNFKNKVLQQNNTNQNLNDTVKIFCWIMTNPKNEYKWRHLEKFWGKRCTKLVFMSSETKYHAAKNIEVIGVPVGVDSRDTLWAKTKEAFIYSYRNYFNDYDWFMKMDDDT